MFLYIFKSLYRERTKASRPTKSGSKNPLFLSYIKPHGPVTSTTPAGWVKSTLAEAGIDTTKFKAHSSRSASSSAAYEAGVALPDIMEGAAGPQFLPSLSFIRNQCAKALLQKQFWVKLYRGHW